MLEPTNTDRVDSPHGLSVMDDDLDRPSSPGRTYSYVHALDKEKQKVIFTLPKEEVRAGLQANLRLFLLHSAEVFLVPEDFEVLVKQVGSLHVNIWYLMKHTILDLNRVIIASPKHITRCLR